MSVLGPALEDQARRAADLLAARLDDLVEEWLDLIWAHEEYRPWARPEMRDPARENALLDIGREIDCLRQGLSLPLSLPDEVSASARMAAVNGLPLGGVLQCYRTGHAVQWRAWQDVVFSLDLDSADSRALLRDGSDFFFRYADMCCDGASRVYAEERERWLQGEEQRQMALVSRLLAGDPVDAAELGYPIAAEHVAIVIRGRTDQLGVLARMLEAELLTVRVDPGTAWGWLGRDGWTGELDRLEELSPPTGTRLAVGGPAAGEDGFRAAHREAELADRVGSEEIGQVTRYDDVALVGLLSQDPEAARAFVAHELGPLLDPGERGARLRQTLRAYLATAHHASSAASLLGVHQRTVANHVRAVEDLLGRSVTERSSELDCALRLARLLELEPS